VVNFSVAVQAILDKTYMKNTGIVC